MVDCAVHVTISGRVQGVSYRAWTKARAEALGLKGWVRNLSDGRVEAVLAGPEKDVDAMIEACHEGPPAAAVDSVTKKPAAEAPAAGFRIRNTV